MTREVPLVSPAISVLRTSGMAHLGTAVEAGLSLPESSCLRPISDASLANVGVSLNECPANLVLQGKTFTLRALIGFQGSVSSGGLGHYTAYCRRAPGVWEFYDDLASGVNTASLFFLMASELASIRSSNFNKSAGWWSTFSVRAVTAGRIVSEMFSSCDFCPPMDSWVLERNFYHKMLINRNRFPL